MVAWGAEGEASLAPAVGVRAEQLLRTRQLRVFCVENLETCVARASEHDVVVGERLPGGGGLHASSRPLIPNARIQRALQIRSSDASAFPWVFVYAVVYDTAVLQVMACHPLRAATPEGKFELVDDALRGGLPTDYMDVCRWVPPGHLLSFSSTSGSLALEGYDRLCVLKTGERNSAKLCAI